MLGAENHEFKNVVKAKRLPKIKTSTFETDIVSYRANFDKIEWKRKSNDTRMAA